MVALRYRMRVIRSLVFTITFLVSTQAAQSSDLKCSACRAVAAHLAEKLDNEKPRNHIDVRHRLDQNGNRHGKVIDFKISELRAIELLDDLCNNDWVLGYQLHSKTNGDEKWILTTSETYGEEIDESLLKAQQQRLRNACSDIMGQYEDDIAGAIRDGLLNSTNVEDVLCIEYGSYCQAQDVHYADKHEL